MKKNDALSYDVHRKESIVVTVTPINFNESLFSVRANLDGNIWEPEPGSQDEPRFEFTVSKPLGDIHTVLFEFNFVAGSPDNARYDVEITGENDEGCPCGFTVRKTTATKDPAVEFFVVN
jgi:hypothetical protein